MQNQFLKESVVIQKVENSLNQYSINGFIILRITLVSDFAYTLSSQSNDKYMFPKSLQYQLTLSTLL